MIRVRLLFSRGLLASAALAALNPQSASAQSAVPDPATIVAPDVAPTGVKQDWEDGNEYFYFHKVGVSFAQAYDDLAECFGYLPSGEVLPVPGFAPWYEKGERKKIERVPAYGLIGLGIAALIAGPLKRSVQNAKLRRCLEPRGYIRYAIPVETWKGIYRAEPQQAVAVLAKLASSPQPNDRPAPQ
jgi:hypothetical protein